MSPYSTSLTPPAVQHGANKAYDCKTVFLNRQSQFSAPVFTVSFCSSLQTLLSLWVSGTVIHSSVLSLQAVHLQIHLALAVVSGDGEPSFNSFWVVFAWATWTCYIWHPFQPFSWRLSYPCYTSITITYPRVGAGQFMRACRFNYYRWRLWQRLGLTTWNKQKAHSSKVWNDKMKLLFNSNSPQTFLPVKTATIIITQSMKFIFDAGSRSTSFHAE